MADTPDADAHSEGMHNEALHQQLEAARRRRDGYQALLKDLPEIFEGKFRERLRPLQQRNEQLMLEGVALREQIRRTLPQQAGSAGFSGALAAGEPTGVEAAAPGTDRASSDAAEPAMSPLSQAAPLMPQAEAPPTGSGKGWRQRGAAVVAAVGLLQHRHSWLLPCGVAIGIAVSLPFVNRLQGPASLAARPAGSTGSDTAGRMLQVRTQGSSWLEVENPDGEKLHYGLLAGQREFPLGQGLRIRAGRPDLVRIRLPGRQEQTLGSVYDIGWHTIPAPLTGR